MLLITYIIYSRSGTKMIMISNLLYKWSINNLRSMYRDDRTMKRASNPLCLHYFVKANKWTYTEYFLNQLEKFLQNTHHIARRQIKTKSGFHAIWNSLTYWSTDFPRLTSLDYNKDIKHFVWIAYQTPPTQQDIQREKEREIKRKRSRQKDRERGREW